MRKIAICLLPACFAWVASATVDVGECILGNPTFDSDQQTVPAGWYIPDGSAVYSWKPNGGPGNVPAIRFDSARDASEKTIKFRQDSFRIKSGGRYRLSGWIRSENFSCTAGQVAVIHNGWDYGVWYDFTGRKDGEWTRFEKEIVPVKPSDAWSLVIYVTGFSGILEFADVRLVPLDAESAEGASPSKRFELCLQPRIIPYAPKLSEISSADRKMSFKFNGRAPGGFDACDLAVSIGARAVTVPLSKSPMTVILPPGPDRGSLTAVVRNRQTGATVGKRSFAYRIVHIPARATVGKRLNGLVEEYVNRPFKAGESGSLALAFRHPVWLYVKADAETVTYDGRVLIGPGKVTPDHEVFVETDLGNHVLAFAGARGGEFIVRRIPQTYDYHVQNHDQQRTYMFNCVTTFGCCGIAKEDEAWFRDTGHIQIGSWNIGETKGPETVQGLYEGWVRRSGAHPPLGFTFDELQPWEPKKCSDYAEWLHALPGDFPHRILTWVVGKPYVPEVNQDIISAVINASGGHGRHMNEIYCRTKPTEAEAIAAARAWLKTNYDGWRALSPVAKEGYSPCFGVFTSIEEGWTLAPYSDADFRYALDLFFNILVNDPEFKDLRMTGVWGSAYSRYCDWQLVPWTFLLFRHYLIDGKRTLLSDKYGFKYHPGFLANGDFITGMDGWTAEGDAVRDAIVGFGDRGERRGAREKLTVGDSFARLTRRGAARAAVRQKVSGLVPGKRYVIDFFSFFPEDYRANRNVRRETGVEVRIDGGALKPQKQNVFIHPRVVRINCHTVLFEAVAETAEISFATTDRTPEGESVGVNDIAMRLSLF